MYVIQNTFPIDILRINRSPRLQYMMTKIEDPKILRRVSSIDEAETIMYERAVDMCEHIKSPTKPTHLMYNISLARTLIDENCGRGPGNVFTYHPIQEPTVESIRPILENVMRFYPTTNCPSTSFFISYCGEGEIDAPVIMIPALKSIYLLPSNTQFNVGFENYTIVIDLE